MESVIIRPEMPADSDGIDAVLHAAFGGADEAALVRQLRADGDLTLSLVAITDDAVVGHVAFTTLSFDLPAATVAWALAPLAVMPIRHRQGIGSALVHHGLEAARRAGIGFVAVLGDPAYYGRFGFRAELAEGLGAPWAGPHFMGLRLTEGPAPAGKVHYARAFSALSP